MVVLTYYYTVFRKTVWTLALIVVACVAAAPGYGLYWLIRGVLLVGDNDLGPTGPDIFVLPRAPHGTLLPRCAVLVHHGGIGTCAAAMQAGIPALVVPFGHDQFDNADRLHHLGVGASLARRRCRPVRLARALERLLTGPAPTCARQVAQQLAEEPCGIATAADAVAEMVT